MTLSVAAADAYIAANVIVTDDWTEADADKKQRILNVASRTLASRFSGYTVPDAAVYEFCAALATAFNDTNKMAQQGVESFSISGVQSFTFRDGARGLLELIPDVVYDLIAEDPANAGLPRPAKRRIGWAIL